MASEIYLNHAGTSHPKPESVLKAIAETLAAPPGDYRQIYEAALINVRQSIGASTGQLLITPSCTHALDVAITELPWQVGDAVLTSQLEHNAVIRPVRNLVKHRGVRHVRAPYHPGDPIDLNFVLRTLKEGRTKLLVLSTASNVTGEVLPIAEISQMARQWGALVFADAAQTFGLLDETVATLGVDLLAFAGHKGPLGPQGVGGLWVRDGVSFAAAEESEAGAVCEVGGEPCAESTVSVRSSVPLSGADQGRMPSYCDVGGVNMPGIAGLSAGLEALGNKRSIQMMAARELAADFAEAARPLKNVTLYGRSKFGGSAIGCGAGSHTATVSLCHSELPLERAEAYFASQGLRIRAGEHCAPDALQAIGASSGTVRVSFGPGSTPKDAEAMLKALSAI